MAVDYNHTIVHVRDRWRAAGHLADVLGLGPVRELGPFAYVTFDNGAVLNFADSIGAPSAVHHAFLVTEDVFDDVLARVQVRGIDYWADPFRQVPMRISTDNGRAFYWADPDDNTLEVLTVPDGGWS